MRLGFKILLSIVVATVVVAVSLILSVGSSNWIQKVLENSLSEDKHLAGLPVCAQLDLRPGMVFVYVWRSLRPVDFDRSYYEVDRYIVLNRTVINGEEFIVVKRVYEFYLDNELVGKVSAIIYYDRHGHCWVWCRGCRNATPGTYPTDDDACTDFAFLAYWMLCNYDANSTITVHKAKSIRVVKYLGLSKVGNKTVLHFVVRTGGLVRHYYVDPKRRIVLGLVTYDKFGPVDVKGLVTVGVSSQTSQPKP